MVWAICVVQMQYARRVVLKARSDLLGSLCPRDAMRLPASRICDAIRHLPWHGAKLNGM